MAGRKPKYDLETRNKIIDAVKEHYTEKSDQEIADMFGVSKDAVDWIRHDVLNLHKMKYINLIEKATE
jgi:predicted DNA-binding protein YlxM (UPF0122 family)